MISVGSGFGIPVADTPGMDIDSVRPIWKRRSFWLVLIAVIVPLGWLVLFWEAGRAIVRARREETSASELPADLVEWLRMRDAERERLRARHPARSTVTTGR